MGRLLIRGGSVLVGPPIDGHMQDSDVLVEDGRIVQIAPGIEADAELLDAGDCFVVPGFVETHHHLWQTTMRGVCADWHLSEYFWCIRRNHAVVHGADDIFAGTYAGALSQLASGTTCTIDFSHCLITPDHADEALRGIQEAGIRGVWCYGFYDAPVEQPHFDGFASRAADARRMAERAGSGGLVRMGIALNELGLVPFEQTRAEVALAEELGVLLTAHTDAVLGVPYQEVDVLHRAGLLGPRQVHSHCNACTDASLALLREHGASVSSTPSTELQMGMGSPIVLRARDAGLLPSLGSDIQSNNREDMFTEMRLGLQAERARSLQALSESEGLAGLASLDGLPLTTREILHYATLGGAEALGLGDVCGSIEVGKAADLVLIRNDSLHLRPIVDPIATIVLHAGPDDVDTVLVDGEVVKRDGRIVHRDVAAATRAIDAAYGRVADAVAQRGGWKPPIPEGMMDQLGTMLFANLGDAVAIA